MLSSRLYLVICILSLSLLPSSSANLLSPQAAIESLYVDPSQLQTGDIIFRRGESMISQFILSTDSDSPFSHAGLIQKIGTQAFVIHAVAGEGPEEGDLVRLEPIERFLAIDRASSAAVYRLREDHNDYAAKAITVAQSYVHDQIPFDLDFDLSTTDKLYCTELIWRAYLDSGLDLVDGEFDELSIPFNKGAYLLPSRLLNSQWLELVIALHLTL